MLKFRESPPPCARVNVLRKTPRGVVGQKIRQIPAPGRCKGRRCVIHPRQHQLRRLTTREQDAVNRRAHDKIENKEDAKTSPTERLHQTSLRNAQQQSTPGIANDQ